MGVQYTLINLDKHEKIAFYDLDCGTKYSEILANPIPTAIYTYHSDFFVDFEDKTQTIDDELVDKHIFQDNGKHLIDADENLFVRDIVLL